MAVLGLAAGTSGNVSARLDDKHVVITPSALPYDEMTARDLVVLTLDGRVTSGTRAPSGERLLHLECYRAFPDVHAVIHTHPVYATMFACARQPIPALVDEFALYVGGDVPCAAYAPSGTPALAANAVGSLGEVRTALLASHGMVTIGATPDAALHQAVVVERSAHIVWGARALGGAVALGELSAGAASPDGPGQRPPGH